MAFYRENVNRDMWKFSYFPGGYILFSSAGFLHDLKLLMKYHREPTVHVRKNKMLSCLFTFT